MRHILHIDMDAFYASVEQRDEPRFRDRPVIVGADPKNGRGRGVVAACSYEARRFGVHSALPISQAWKLCPDAVYLRPRMERYSEVSATIMGIFRSYTDQVEPLSIDEAFLDVTGSTRLLGAAETIARNIKYEIRERTGLTGSVGVAPNKFLAKIASDLRKPDGLVVVREDAVQDFLWPLPIGKLWGVGPRTARTLETMGVRTIGQLAGLSRRALMLRLGAPGEHLWNLAHGRDERQVVIRRQPKSVSNEQTFERDTRDPEYLRLTLRRLSDRVAARLRQGGHRARKITLKLRYASFTTHTRQVSSPEPVDTGEDVFRLAYGLFMGFDLEESVRLLGVGAGDLVDDRAQVQMPLFPAADRDERLARVVDALHERFGHGSIRRGSDLG